MNKQNSKKFWFKAKRYGYGWYPATWQGWLILGIYVLLLAGIFRIIDSVSHSGSDTLYGVVVPYLALTGILVVICYLTGEKPGWHWGDK